MQRGMKRCPTCSRIYTDDSLNFCLEDGTTLVAEPPSQYMLDPTISVETVERRRSDPPPTEILPPPTEQITQRPEPRLTNPAGPARPTVLHSPELPPQSASVTQQPPRRNTAVIVGLTVVATILLISLGSLGAWFFMRGKNDTQSNTARTGNNQNAGPTSQSNNRGAQTNSSANSNAASNPTPALKVNEAAVRQEITDLLNGWTAATRARDLNAFMSYYADTLDVYYNNAGVSAGSVQADRRRAFNMYSTIDVRLSNIKITPEATGQKATATFDKYWNFEGEKFSSGSVQQRLWFAKIDNHWRITGEKDLQVYYVNK